MKGLEVINMSDLSDSLCISTEHEFFRMDMYELSTSYPYYTGVRKFVLHKLKFCEGLFLCKLVKVKKDFFIGLNW